MAREIDDILEGIAEILRQDKELLLEGVFWRRLPRTGFDALELTAPIAIAECSATDSKRAFLVDRIWRSETFTPNSRSMCQR
jgi:hypothetical protein